MSGASFDDSGVDKDRRRFLTTGVSVVGAVGVAAAAVPFVSSMQPSEKAKTAGAPVEVDISKLLPGMKMDVKWRGKPVYIIRRTSEMLAELDKLADVLADPESTSEQQPDYARNHYRSINPEFLIMVAHCTHLGCSPKFRPEQAPEDLGADWKGGFYCPCHGSRFDLAGRVYSGQPAPANMPVPPHRYVSDNVIVIGEEEGTA
ncbi:MAG: ubiquinol-cytochrome c reductase iron-sulfur subunit [Gammaproteobacteria bacterium]|nr:ubiquinol-cytochrome c reductase iron-sulfur subunit [Gammaproteobacteria bacterium]